MSRIYPNIPNTLHWLWTTHSDIYCFKSWMVTYIFYILPFFISPLSLLLVVWYLPCIEQEPHKWGCSPSLPEYKRQSDCSPTFICMYLYISILKNEYIFVCNVPNPPQCRDCRRWYRETRCTIQSNFHSGSVPEVLMKNTILGVISYFWFKKSNKINLFHAWEFEMLVWHVRSIV